LYWRELLGLKPTEADLAQELIQPAAKSGDASWTYDAEHSSLNSGGRTINLANIHCESSGI
jgi:hypothetical protein